MLAGMKALDRARLVTADLELYRKQIEEASGLRVSLMRQAEAQGATRTEIAKATGLTKGRVVQILGANEPGRGGRPGVEGGKPRTKAVKAPKPAEPVPDTPVQGPKPEAHRHHYANVAWNHTRGAYLVRQRCDCGDERVIPAPNIPKDLTGEPDPTVRAA